METARSSTAGICCRFLLCLLCALPAFGQQTLGQQILGQQILGQQVTDAPSIPSNFHLDLETAARLRPQLMEQSVPATGEYVTGRLVFDRLIRQLPQAADTKLKWELRIVEDNEFNAYSSPDGSIYVENGLARLAGRSAGLWAAILSHEVAHVVRRDWARRYLYQKQLETRSAAIVVLGNPGVPFGSGAQWTDARTSSEDFARFCRQLEIEADRLGLTLMARAGYHPDFVPALHHLLHAQAATGSPDSLAAMHPCWEDRDRELERAYVNSSIEFEHRWLEWYASPGGNPPTLVFAEAPSVRRTSSDKVTGAKQWEIQVPMHCENLVGAIEVVLRAYSTAEIASSRHSAAGNTPRINSIATPRNSYSEQRQFTGCTSPKTIVTFTLEDSPASRAAGSRWTDVYILDADGAVLARADVPKFP